MMFHKVHDANSDYGSVGPYLNNQWKNPSCWTNIGAPHIPVTEYAQDYFNGHTTILAWYSQTSDVNLDVANIQQLEI